MGGKETQTITGREWEESELSKTGGQNEAKDDNWDLIWADLWSCVDYSTSFIANAHLLPATSDTAAIFQHCPLQAGRGSTTVGRGNVGQQRAIIWHLTRLFINLHLQKKERRKNQCKKEGSLKTSHYRLQRRMQRGSSDCVGFELHPLPSDAPWGLI